jgi:hypothetical protein
MAAGAIPINRSVPEGAELYDAIRQLRGAIRRLTDIQASMVQQIDTAPNPDDYSLLETHFGLDAGLGDDAKAELDSMLSKLTTDASVSFVAAAIAQACAKFGVIG